MLLLVTKTICLPATVSSVDCEQSLGRTSASEHAQSLDYAVKKMFSRPEDACHFTRLKKSPRADAEILDRGVDGLLRDYTHHRNRKERPNRYLVRSFAQHGLQAEGDW